MTTTTPISTPARRDPASAETPKPALQPALGAVPGAETEALVSLDPRTIRLPDVPNRAVESYGLPEYMQLRDSVIASRGNLQPIHVRMVQLADATWHYELIYGERRLRACIDAGVNVRATIEAGPPVTEVFVKRLVENRGRADLAPLELGWQVKYVLQNSSHTQSSLAKAIGCSEAVVSRAHDLAKLPADVLGCFRVVHGLRYEDLKPLKDSLKKNSAAVLKEAQAIQHEEEPVPGREVVRRLVAAANSDLASCKIDQPKLKRNPVVADGKTFGDWAVSANGALEVSISAPMSDLQRQALVQHVALFLERKVLKASAPVPKEGLPSNDNEAASTTKARPRPGI